jgi:membrane protein CcdC involved in cytochrome C biogenesis
LTNLYAHYAEMIEMQWLVYEHREVNKKIGSVVIEPLLLGAGGMKFVDPLWQRALIDVAKAHNVPVIFDEVAAGLHRLGVKSCREILKIGKHCTFACRVPVCRATLEYMSPRDQSCLHSILHCFPFFSRP